MYFLGADYHVITVEERGDGDYGVNPLELMSLTHKSDDGAYRLPH
jgi:hypothetical protein